MEQKRTVLLTGTELFSKGSFENATLEGGYVAIERLAGQYMQYGCYTSPEIALAPFCNLNISWNADVPANTLIEVHCRVLADGAWSAWASLGKWALDYPRQSIAKPVGDDNTVYISGDTLTVGVSGGGQAAQAQVRFFTNDEKVSPALRLLAFSARPIGWQQQQGAPLNSTLYLPEYALARHQNDFGESMQLPIVLTALMNRYGEDALPEEVAFGMQDARNALCENVAYGAAMVGCCGYECFQAWLDLKEIYAEIHSGCSVAVQLAEGCGTATQKTHWVALHGITHDEAAAMDHVVLMDPLAQMGENVACTITTERFAQCFTGRAVLVRNNLHGLRKQRPLRVCCAAKATEEQGVFRLTLRGEPFALPDDFGGWIACAHKEGIAYATTAHRKFTPMTKTPSGDVCFAPECVVPSARYTLYIVAESGMSYTAELTIPNTPAAQNANAQTSKMQTAEKGR